MEDENGSFCPSEPAGLRIPQSRGELDMPYRLSFERNAQSDSSDERSISSQVTSHLSDTSGLADRGSIAVFEEIHPAFDAQRSALDRRQLMELAFDRPSASQLFPQLSTSDRWEEIDSEELSLRRTDSETADRESQVYGPPVDDSFRQRARTRSRGGPDNTVYAEWRRRVFQSQPPGPATGTATGATSGSYSYIRTLSSALPRIPTAEPRSHLLENVRQAWRP